MSTKAEEFRYWRERSGAKKAKAAPKARKAAAPGGSLPGVSGRSPEAAPARKPSARAGKKALYALEAVAAGTRPSRKSTRKATNRQRTDAQMRVKQRTQEVRPSGRAGLRSS